MGKFIKKKFKIVGMSCTSCAMNIDFDLEDLEEVKSARTSYAKSECEVEFSEDLGLEKIAETIKKAGFDII